MERADLGGSRVAVLSDVHGNAGALEAVLAELATLAPDVVVVGGDLTWGPLPVETLALVASLPSSTVFVRGNAERALVDMARGRLSESSERSEWMLAQHTAEAIDFLATFVEQAVVEIEGLGAVRFCHGSPRTDEECVTPQTPRGRVVEFMEGVAEKVIVTAHTHLQFDRRVAGIRSVNPGSVGRSYHDGAPGARWALLGPDVDLRRTGFDVDAVARRYRASSDPARELMVEHMYAPPTPAEVIEHAERVVFAG